MRRAYAVAAAFALTACTHGATPGPTAGPTEATPLVGTDPCPAPAELLAAPPAKGQRLPDVALPCIGHEGTVRMAALGGTPTVVNLWGSWCYPCRTEMPEFQQVHLALGAKVRFLGVDTKDTENAARSAIQRAAVSYPSVFDPGERIKRAVNTRSLPTTVLVGADGLVKTVHVGELTGTELRALVARYLGVS
jgi:cytochrome c biogenesis protein CcmG/thiol:disulfide interchange protein DsbE